MSEERNSPPAPESSPSNDPEIILPPDTYTPSTPPGAGVRRGLLIGCSVIVLAICFLMVGGTYWFSRQMDRPEMKLVLRQAVRVAVCRKNLEELGGAIDRYAIAHNGKYPKRAEELGEYLRDKKMLVCPEDTDRKSGSSYQINTPSHSAPWLIKCSRHTRAGFKIEVIMDKDKSVREEVVR